MASYPGNLLHSHSGLRHDRDNVCRSSRGAHTPSMPAFLHKVRKSRRTCEASSGVPTLLVNTRAESRHSSPATSRASACRF
jgi:hypothetical protein